MSVSSAGKGAQMQRVSIVGEEGKGSMCGKATKDIARGEASVPCKGKSTRKGEEVKESRGKRGSMHG